MSSSEFPVHSTIRRYSFALKVPTEPFVGSGPIQGTTYDCLRATGK